MERRRQTYDEIIGSLSRIESEWKDDHARSVLELLDGIKEKSSYTADDLKRLLAPDYEAGITLIRLFLDLSKDELEGSLRELGAKRNRKKPEALLQALISLGILEKMQKQVESPVTWKDVLVERLKTGRGSAIRAQVRGRFLEDKTEEIVREVFGIGHYDARCRFVGANGREDEKADFAIPSKQDPRILIEVKAYGATGSKQTDILGDMGRIVGQKRHDTTLLFVTDGVTWKLRPSDLRRLIDMQNKGHIARIYTWQMFPDLRQDLLRLRSEHGLESEL
ncbi:MAG TPA: DpnII family type II restriction endonuclease [Thermoanaerobaculia bacterium]|nr:DpnII family type II restriction endonuclease [Thermoanaerobaculia bacterium]